MSTFRATPDDLADLIRYHQGVALRRAVPYPLGALVTGVLALWADRTLASFAFGAAAAWGYSTFQETRAVRSAYLWQYAWLQEEVTVVAEEEGLRLSNARGSSFLRWNGGISVHSQPGFFLIKDEHEDLAYFPKKYLSDRELLALNRHASQQRPSVTGAPAKHGDQADEARDR